MQGGQGRREVVKTGDWVLNNGTSYLGEGQAAISPMDSIIFNDLVKRKEYRPREVLESAF
jgi:hypothetical protein